MNKQIQNVSAVICIPRDSNTFKRTQTPTRSAVNARGVVDGAPRSVVFNAIAKFDPVRSRKNRFL